MSEVNSLTVARAKLANVIEIYAPMHAALRERAIEALQGAIVEFEAAVREDAGEHLQAAQAQAAQLSNDLSASNARLAAAPVDAPPAVYAGEYASDFKTEPVVDERPVGALPELAADYVDAPAMSANLVAAQADGTSAEAALGNEKQEAKKRAKK